MLRRPRLDVRRRARDPLPPRRRAHGRDSAAAMQPLPLPEGMGDAAAAAATYRAEMAEMGALLAAHGVDLPKQRFDDTNAELFRFAATMGLLKACTLEERQHALELGAARAEQTASWLRTHVFMPPSERAEWADFVQWVGADSARRPVLAIRLGPALRSCDAAAAARFAEAVVAEVEAAVGSRLSNAPGRPEQLVVVLDCRGAPTLQVAKVVRLIQSIALTLNKHYPARLHRLFLVETPRVVHWPVQAIKQLLHPTTAAKIILCGRDDARLPISMDAVSPPNPAQVIVSQRPDSHQQRWLAKSAYEHCSARMGSQHVKDEGASYTHDQCRHRCARRLLCAALLAWRTATAAQKALRRRRQCVVRLLEAWRSRRCLYAWLRAATAAKLATAQVAAAAHASALRWEREELLQLRCRAADGQSLQRADAAALHKLHREALSGLELELGAVTAAAEAAEARAAAAEEALRAADAAAADAEAELARLRAEKRAAEQEARKATEAAEEALLAAAARSVEAADAQRSARADTAAAQELAALMARLMHAVAPRAGLHTALALSGAQGLSNGAALADVGRQLGAAALTERGSDALQVPAHVNCPW
ncbi:hypothetical protein WJX81_006250 [Elliptochloris bilobata]|uniref:CRAL-TRIO domain-containing protein n=1 Tax=Elliptochloris bilobata TaxID=381761 RepID=A0AAW1R2W2_9CHLO